MTTQCVVRAAECNSPWRGKCPKDKRGPSPARGTSYSETPDIPSGTYCLIKYGLYVFPSGFEVKGFPHPPLRGPPSLLGKADGYRSSLICGMGFNFQLSILSFQFYPRRLPLPSALGPGPSSLCSLTTDDCSLTTVYCGQRPPLSLTHKAKSPPKAEYENVKGEKPWKLFGRNGPLL